MATAKKKTVKSAASSKASGSKAKKHFLKTPVGVAIIITLVIAALVFVTGKSQEDRSAVDAMSEYPAEQLQNVDDTTEASDEAGDVEDADGAEDEDDEVEAEQSSETSGY